MARFWIKGKMAHRLAFAGLSLAILTTACRSGEKDKSEVPQTVRVGVAQMTRPNTQERYSASFEAWRQVDLAFKSPGLIASILQVRDADGRVRDVEPGDEVSQGTTLAVVRQVDYKLQLDQARAQAKVAEANLAGAEAVFRDAESDFKRAEDLYKTASLTKPDYDQAKARFESAAQQVAAAQAAVNVAQAAESASELALSDTMVRAPFTGWVTARNVSKGTLAGATTLGFTMMDTSTLKAMFAVPDMSLRNVHAGQRLTVSLDAVEHPVSGTVIALSAAADPKSRVFTIEVAVPNPKGEMRPGMIGSIALGPEEDARPRLMIPLSAVVRSPESSRAFAVFLVEQRMGRSFVRSQRITVGETFGNSIEVTSGLVEGDRVVTLGAELLRDGQQVNLL
jgi:multidrug efflux system membrane fusion protein